LCISFLYQYSIDYLSFGIYDEKNGNRRMWNQKHSKSQNSGIEKEYIYHWCLVVSFTADNQHQLLFRSHCGFCSFQLCCLPPAQLTTGAARQIGAGQWLFPIDFHSYGTDYYTIQLTFSHQTKVSIADKTRARFMGSSTSIDSCPRYSRIKTIS
jgi:hypothetical protein